MSENDPTPQNLVLEKEPANDLDLKQCERMKDTLEESPLPTAEEGPWKETVGIIEELRSLYKTNQDQEVLAQCVKQSSEISNLYKNAGTDAKQIIKDLTQSVAEKKAAAKEEEELKAANAECRLLEDKLEDLNSKIKSGELELEHSKQAIEDIEKKIIEAKAKVNNLKTGRTVDIPVLRHSLNLYANITSIKWDFSATDVIKGSIIDEEKGRIHAFTIDPREHSEFDLANQLWSLLDREG